MARLVFTSEYYTLELTDLCSVWSEHLESAGLRERQQKCSCPVTLQSRGEILHFGEFLSKHLPYAEIRTDEEGYAVKVGHTALGKEISFEFELEKIAPAKASLILAELTLGFKNVIEALGNRLEQLNEVIQEKNYHIRAMADAVSRSSVYVPRRHESAYDDAFKKKGEPIKTSFSELLSDNWPSKLTNTADSTVSPVSTPQPVDTAAREARLKRRAELKKTPARLKRPRLF